MPLIRSRLLRTTPVSILAALVIGGCGADPMASTDPYKRVAVAGTVKLNGSPLSEGTIQLDPAPETKGPTTSGEIHEGKFSIDLAQGPVAGKYIVRISGRPAVKVNESDQPGGTPKVVPDPVPASYNKKSKLETNIPPEGSSSLEFDLKK